MRRNKWLVFWLVLQGLAMSYGLWQGHENDEDLHALIRAEQHEDTVEEAQRCVTAWSVREDVRDGDEQTYRSNAETLISLATTTSPERIAQYRELVERDVKEIRAQLPNPDCDLDAANRLLAREGN